jgi:hypothetical protein
VDFIVCHEGEITLEHLVRSQRGELPIESVEGLCFRDSDNSVVENPPRKMISDLDILPIPDRKLIDMEFYKRYNHQLFNFSRKKPIATIMTSRGCPYECVFCCSKNMWKRRYRPRRLAQVFQEIEMLVSDYGIREICILDDQFIMKAVGFDRYFNNIIPNLTGQPLVYGFLTAFFFSVHMTRHMFKIPRDLYQKAPKFINHHLSHVNSAFYCSDFENANILSLDGSGGNNAGLIGYAEGTKLETYYEICNSDSLGHIFSRITRLLGFRPHADEYKVMGLASFGTPDPKGLPFLEWNKQIPYINRTKYRQYRKWVHRVVDPKAPMKKISQDIAATAQASLEKVALRMLEWSVQKNQSRNLCV